MWLAGRDGVTVGGFLYLTLAAIFVGLLCSTLRWLLLDRIHELTGIKQPDWDLTRLQSNLEAFTLLLESHYRYYQFYGNSLFGSSIAYASWRSLLQLYPPILADAVFLVIATLLFLGSRDTLRKYYGRVDLVLSSESESTIIAPPFDFSKNST